MASVLMSKLSKRQYGNPGYAGTTSDCSDDSDYCNNDSWWWSTQGMAVRYIIVAVLCVVFIAFFIGGYWHAQHRVRKGLAPLAYHSWMVRRTIDPRPRQHAAPYYRPSQQNYGMQEYPPPPPAYNHNEAPPPVYTAPEGGTKVLPEQNVTVVRENVERQGAGESSEQAGVAVPPPTAAAGGPGSRAV